MQTQQAPLGWLPQPHRRPSPKQHLQALCATACCGCPGSACTPGNSGPVSSPLLKLPAPLLSGAELGPPPPCPPQLPLVGRLTMCPLLPSFLLRITSARPLWLLLPHQQWAHEPIWPFSLFPTLGRYDPETGQGRTTSTKPKRALPRTWLAFGGKRFYCWVPK